MLNDTSDEKRIKIDENLAKHLKPHQIEGVKFMWDACFGSLKEMQNAVGGGCILAHCMGLGKTLQVNQRVKLYANK